MYFLFQIRACNGEKPITRVSTRSIRSSSFRRRRFMEVTFRPPYFVLGVGWLVDFLDDEVIDAEVVG